MSHTSSGMFSLMSLLLRIANLQQVFSFIAPRCPHRGLHPSFLSMSSQKTVQAGWDNHFSAFGEQDVDKILKDYTEASVVSIYDMRSGKEDVSKGLDAIRKTFTGLFETLSDTSGLDAPLIDVHGGKMKDQGSVFLVWKCPSSGIDLATDTFVFDDNGNIVKQTVVVWTTETGEAGTCTNTDPTGGPIQVAWDNHFGAFGGQDVDKILVDYDKNSVVTLWDKKSETRSVFKGLEAVKQLFIGLFSDLSDMSELSAPLIQVTEDPKTVFLVWKCPSSGVVSATDTFVFDDNAKIKYQNVVVEK